MSERDLLRQVVEAELSSCTQHVRALLERAASMSEREILAAGARVEELYREAQGNVGSLKELAAEFDCSSSEGRANLDALMRRNAMMMTHYLLRLNGGIEKQKECTTAVTDVAQKIAAFVRGVKNVSVELGILTLNARLEAARWGSSGAAFATVASTMRELTTEVAKSNEQIGGLADELSEIAARVQESADLMAELSEGLTDDLGSHMTALNGAYEAARRSSSEAVEKGVQRADHLVELANAILRNLQFQDRMAQVLHEAEVVVKRAESVTSDLLASVPEGASDAEVRAAIEQVLASAGRRVVRISGESELASSDTESAAGIVELF